MEEHRRATDGRRLLTAEFKWEQLARVERQEVTLAELARSGMGITGCQLNASANAPCTRTIVGFIDAD